MGITGTMIVPESQLPDMMLVLSCLPTWVLYRKIEEIDNTCD